MIMTLRWGASDYPNPMDRLWLVQLSPSCSISEHDEQSVLRSGIHKEMKPWNERKEARRPPGRAQRGPEDQPGE